MQNFLEFYIEVGCEIEIKPQDAIFVNVRLAWTLEEFYAGDGLTTFADRMAAVLGVPASNIKVVSVYEGAGRRLQGGNESGLTVDFQVVIPEPTAPENPEDPPAPTVDEAKQEI